MNDKYHCSCQQEETSPVDLALLCTKYPELLSNCRQSLAENQQCSSLIMRDRWIRHRCITGGGNSFVRCVSFFYT